MEIIGNWWNDRTVDLVQLKDGAVYALSGWNGEVYTSCWECTGDHYMEASEEEYTLRPVYRVDAEHMDLSKIEEDSPEWDRAWDIVDYDVSQN